MNTQDKQPKEQPAKNEHEGQKLTCIEIEKLPDSAFIRESQMVSKPEQVGILPFSSSTLWRYIKSCEFPAPVKLSPKSNAWRLGDVRQWLAARSAAQSATK